MLLENARGFTVIGPLLDKQLVHYVRPAGSRRMSAPDVRFHVERAIHCVSVQAAPTARRNCMPVVSRRLGSRNDPDKAMARPPEGSAVSRGAATARCLTHAPLECPTAKTSHARGGCARLRPCRKPPLGRCAAGGCSGSARQNAHGVMHVRGHGLSGRPRTPLFVARGQTRQGQATGLSGTPRHCAIPRVLDRASSCGRGP